MSPSLGLPSLPSRSFPSAYLSVQPSTVIVASSRAAMSSFAYLKTSDDSSSAASSSDSSLPQAGSLHGFWRAFTFRS